MTPPGALDRASRTLLVTGALSLVVTPVIFWFEASRITELKPILIDEAVTLSRRLGNPQQGEHAA